MTSVPNNFIILDSLNIKSAKPKTKIPNLSGNSDTEFDFLEQDLDSSIAIGVITDPKLQSGTPISRLPVAVGYLSPVTSALTTTYKIFPVAISGTSSKGANSEMPDTTANQKTIVNPAVHNSELPANAPSISKSTLMQSMPPQNTNLVNNPIEIVSIERNNFDEKMPMVVKTFPTGKLVSIQTEPLISATQTEIQANRNIETITINIIKMATLSSASQVSRTPDLVSPTASDTIQKVSTQSKQPAQTMRLQLLPHNLGTVDITITKINGKISVEIETAQAQTDTLLRAQLITLTKGMDLAGLVLEEITIRYNPTTEITQVGQINLTNQTLTSNDNFSHLSKNFRSSTDPKLENTTDSGSEKSSQNPYREGVYL